MKLQIRLVNDDGTHAGRVSNEIEFSAADVEAIEKGGKADICTWAVKEILGSLDASGYTDGLHGN